MTRFVLTAALFAFVGLATADDASNKALKELEGEYTVKSMEKDGKPDEDERKKVERFTIKGDAISVKEKGREKENTVTIKIDPSKKPAHIDITPKGVKDTLPGIYSLEKGELTILFSHDGDRPKEFTAKGDGIMKVVLVKKKAEK